jgi:CheY-like chemotaxis protein
MAEPERIIELLLAIETETAGFYEDLARNADDPPEVRALWISLAEEERRHATWVRRLHGSRLVEGVVASLPVFLVLPLQAALDEIRRQRERIEHRSATGADALAAAIALETSEASRAFAGLVVAISRDCDADPFLPTPGAHLGQLAQAAQRLGVVDIAASARDLLRRVELGMASRRTVLVVDDDADMVDTCARILHRSGHDCLTATSGLDALALLHRHRPNLILADLRMPGMDGLAFLTHARRMTPQVPVVIFTAYGSMETARQARDSGAAAYLSKPFSVAELQDAVAQTLAARAAREGGLGSATDQGPTGPSQSSSSI